MSVVAATLALVGVLVLLYFLRKAERKNHIVTIQETQLHWQDVKCVHCSQSTEYGYAFAGKGISWMPIQRRKPGVFSTIFSTLENIVSLRIPPPLNMAWHCQHCKLILIDHSKLIRI